MNRLFEGLIRFILHEKLLQRFEKKVARGEVTAIDVFLKRGMEYAVRAWASKGSVTPVLTLGDPDGAAAPTVCYWNNRCNYFSVRVEEDRKYRILAAVEPDGSDREPATIMVSLCRALPPPHYISDGAVTIPRALTKLALKDNGLAKSAPCNSLAGDIR